MCCNTAIDDWIIRTSQFYILSTGSRKKGPGKNSPRDIKVEIGKMRKMVLRKRGLETISHRK